MPSTERKSTMNFRKLALLTILSSIALPYAWSQAAAPTLAASALTAVPPLVPYSGQVEGRTGQASATFLIYKDQTGGEPLFTESQMIGFDPTGHYKVQLGAANPHGLPPDLFQPVRHAGWRYRSPGNRQSLASCWPAFLMRSKLPTLRLSAASPLLPLLWLAATPR